jgi:hypothetical protein
MTKVKLPTKYLPSLSKKKDIKKQVKMLMKSRKQYKKGNFFTRKNVKSYKSKPSNHITDAKKIYNIENVSPNKELARKTGCSLYYSSGSRPNQTPQSWGLARLASSITAGKSAAVDYNILEKGCNHKKKAFILAKKSRRKYKFGHSKTRKTTVNV